MNDEVCIRFNRGSYSEYPSVQLDHGGESFVYFYVEFINSFHPQSLTHAK